MKNWAVKNKKLNTRLYYVPSQIPADELDSVYAGIKELGGFLPPVASRYLERDVIGYVSSEAFHSYMLGVLRTYASVLGDLGEIPKEVADEIVEKVNRDNVPFSRADYWEGQVRHDVRGVVRACQEVLSDRARSFIYPGLTSYDVINTAQSMGLQDFAHELMIPETMGLSRELIQRAREHKETVMVGRTHKQHAAATTAGRYFCNIIAGIIPPMFKYKRSAGNLRGKISGFVGNNAAKLMLFEADPDEINRMFFERIGLEEDYAPSQVVHQHWYHDYFSRLVAILGGVAKFAEDLRNFQQTEVGEMFEQKLSDQAGSSTGAHKRNPISSEQIAGGRWRQARAQLMAGMEDFVTDFERDLRDSSNKRAYIHLLADNAYGTVKKAAGVARKMTVRAEKMAENLGMTRGLIVAEPLQNYVQRWVGLSGGPFVDAYEHVKGLADRAAEEGVNFIDLIREDPFITRALGDASDSQREMILCPEKYPGTSVRDVERLTEMWEGQLFNLEECLDKELEIAAQRV